MNTASKCTDTVVIAIIPSRAGSKGLPGKNTKLLAGKPLINHTIEAALRARSITHVAISTDDPAVVQCGAQYGVTVLRHPPELSSDGMPTYPVVRWALAELERLHGMSDICVVLRPTTPLRTEADIDAAVDLLKQNCAADSVVSVCLAVGVHPKRLKRVLGNGELKDAFEREGYSPAPRQSLEALYVRNGGIYAARRQIIYDYGLWGNASLAYVMPEERSVNINTEFDFRVADLLARNPDSRN